MVQGVEVVELIQGGDKMWRRIGSWTAGVGWGARHGGKGEEALRSTPRLQTGLSALPVPLT